MFPSKTHTWFCSRPPHKRCRPPTAPHRCLWSSAPVSGRAPPPLWMETHAHTNTHTCSHARTRPCIGRQAITEQTRVRTHTHRHTHTNSMSATPLMVTTERVFLTIICCHAIPCAVCTTTPALQCHMPFSFNCATVKQCYYNTRVILQAHKYYDEKQICKPTSWHRLPAVPIHEYLQWPCGCKATDGTGGDLIHAWMDGIIKRQK